MLSWRPWLGWAAVMWLGLAIACVGAAGDATPAPEATPAAAITETPAATPDPSPTAPPAPTVDAAASPQDPAPPPATPAATPTPPPSRWTLTILEDSRARYLVREQFARLSLPTDAVGVTRDVSGVIVFDGDGTVRPEESLLVVDLRTLRSDDADRDDFLRGEALESDRYPLAEFVVQEAPGLPWPLPQEGEVTFQLVGDMTLHNYTRPLTWEVTAQFAPDQVTGTARTSFTFETFHMVRPTRVFLLSVDDNIRLELDFIVSVVETEVEDG